MKMFHGLVLPLTTNPLRSCQFLGPVSEFARNGPHRSRNPPVPCIYEFTRCASCAVKGAVRVQLQSPPFTYHHCQTSSRAICHFARPRHTPVQIRTQLRPPVTGIYIIYVLLQFRLPIWRCLSAGNRPYPTFLACLIIVDEPATCCHPRSQQALRCRSQPFNPKVAIGFPFWWYWPPSA